MSIELKVPMLPESVADATVVSWRKQAGERVKRDEHLVDIETDKVVLEVPAPEDGILLQVLKGDGTTVTADEVLALIEPGAAGEASAQASAAVAESAPARTPAPASTAAPAATPAATAAVSAEAPTLSPAVRRLVTEHGLDPQGIPASGPGGRLTKEDVLKFLAESSPAPAPAPERRAEVVALQKPAPREEAKPAAPAEAEAAGGMTGERPERRVPMTRIRARIAERLVEAQRNAAILTTFNEVNLHRVIELRRQYQERFEKQHGVRLGMMSFFVRACVEALKRFPAVNASIDGGDIVYHGYYDIGIAVASPRGLVVPILRDVDRLTMAQIESGTAEFGRKAKENALSIDELTGGTFSISNGGVFGSLLSTPILNPPQSGILGMHKIEDRPMVEEGEIRIRPMMYVALSYDHRIIDGREAVQFLVAIKEALEDPARMLLQV